MMWMHDFLAANTPYIIASGVFGLLWGSFLNVVAVRLLAERSLTLPSACPHCNQLLSWRELIPLASWVYSAGRCQHCNEMISAWYPITEFLTALWCIALICTQPIHYLLPLLLFGSALIVTIRTDGEQFTILRICTIGIMPIGFTASFMGFLHISWQESIFGSLIGLSILAATRLLFRLLRGQEGIGEGDVELLSAIGSFVGPLGVWLTLMVASTTATFYAVSLIVLRKASLTTAIPFGLFLAIAGGLICLIQPYLLSLV